MKGNPNLSISSRVRWILCCLTTKEKLRTWCLWVIGILAEISLSIISSNVPYPVDSYRYLVVHETTNGPFDPNQSFMASFAPSEEMEDCAREYLEKLSEEVSSFVESYVHGKAHPPYIPLRT